MHRAQILLDPHQHRALRELAKRQGRSISSVVREMINDQLVRLKREQDSQVRHHLAVIDRIRDHKRAVLEKRDNRPIAVDVVKIIDKNRAERDGSIVKADRQLGD
jgi:hypothetical protein